MAYLLDSNLLVYSAIEAHKFLRPLALNTQNFVSAISKVETLGFHKLEAADEVYFNSLFALVTLLPVTPNIIETAILLRQQRRMSLGDSLIAATAIEFDLTLATRNVSDFTSISKLTVYDPFQS
ncbi:type II toxin-antitoxin system VapC family toxin [Hymenobacter siberiensis]|jgi:predicted nucleic acid-binding protein|uniref:type II toxin-antitoxin system VapC family toxin n=1 Tax=Hymenobacter siberiensis TaxID=2848396 RepID=UPI001C1E7384|nr:type II toxin-antitoxin system VapC family toxin [Hymenobacter siberiensis]MBU6121615.1 type II toxin-antitoxin system VapC family toxin [Hymenobacter siberiensis]